MTRLLAIFATIMLASATAGADHRFGYVPRTAGTKGTVTAWDITRSTVIEHRSCVRSRYSWYYATCGSIVRQQVKAALCASKGPGRHRYLYQVGDHRPMVSTVYCRR